MKQLALAALAVGLLLLGFSLPFLLPGKPETPETPRVPDTSATPTEPEQAQELATPKDAGLSEPPAPATEARTTVAEAPVAPRILGGWESAGKRMLRGRVVFPDGTPADPTLRVLALARKLGNWDLYGASGAVAELEKANVSDSGPKVFATAMVQPDGSFELPFPADQSQGWVWLDGRFLVLREPVQAELQGDQGFTIEPALGAWIHGSILLPEGVANREEVFQDCTATLVYDTASARINPLAMANDMVDFLERSERPNATGEFEFRGVDSSAPNRLRVRCEVLAAAFAEIKAGPGQDLRVDVALLHGGTIRGRVADDAGNPLAEVRVRAATGSLFGFATDRVGETTSGADGAFELAHVAPGKVQIHASLDGYLDAAPLNLEVADREDRGGVLIDLGRGASLAGRVTFEDGSPAVGAEVDVSFDPAALASMAAFNAARGADGEAQTGEDGSFVVTGLGKGPFQLSAELERDGVGHAARRSGLKPGDTDLELVLRPEPGIDGHVVTKNGAALAKFSVTLASDSQAMWMMADSEKREFEDPNGAFSFQGLKEGRWKIQAQAEGYGATPWLPLELPREPGAPPLVLTLEPEALATGRVVDPEGNPVVGASVRPALDLQQSLAGMAGKSEIPEAKTLEDGRFTLGGLSAGAVTLVATHPGWVDSSPETREVRAGETTGDIELALRRGGVLTGLVYGPDRKTAGGATIYIQSQAAGFMPTMLKTEPDGTFRRESLIPGTWQVTAMLGELDVSGMVGSDEAPDFSAFLSGMRTDVATIEEGKETHVVLGAPPENPVALKGVVMHAGEPVAKALVTMYPDGSSGLKDMQFTSTDADGAFAFELGHSGKYLMSVQILGERAMAQDTLEFPQVIPDSESHEVRVDLPVGRISGRVIGVDGEPAAGARITLTVDGPIRFGSLLGGRYVEAQADDQGRYDLRYLSPGTYSLGAGGSVAGGAFGGTADEGRVVQSGITVQESEWVEHLNFRLHKPGEIGGRVLDATGSPVPEAAVFVRNEQGHVLERFSMIATDATGRFRYAGVAPGRYTVSARTADLASAESVLVDVQEGGTSEALLTMQAGTMLKVNVVDENDGSIEALISVLDDEGRQVNGLVSYQELLSATHHIYSTVEEVVGPLPAGRYSVTAITPDGRTVTKPVTLNGQAERKLKIRLK